MFPRSSEGKRTILIITGETPTAVIEQGVRARFSNEYKIEQCLCARLIDVVAIAEDFSDNVDLYALVIIDVPGDRGPELVYVFWNMQGDAHIPIIFVSSNSEYVRIAHENNADLGVDNAWNFNDPKWVNEFIVPLLEGKRTQRPLEDDHVTHAT